MRMEIVRKAQRFATEKHRGQRRTHYDAPYTDHLRSVVSLLRAYGQTDSHVIAAAWLHDTVEKTSATVQCIVEEFGDGIGELVYWLTDTGQGEGDILARTTAWRLGGAPWDAKLIKLADIIDNGRVIMKHDRAKAPRFVSEKRMVLQHMQVREGDMLRAHPLFHVAAMLVRDGRDNVAQFPNKR
jgi:(p)ppGpp synthase/HD superfamily hydrolase